MAQRRWQLVPLVLAAALALGCPVKTVLIDAPRVAQLFDDPSPSVRGAGRVGKNFDLASVAVVLDGVDLVDALGLAPPFAGAGGSVALPSGPVAISGFSVGESGPNYGVTLDVAGLAPGGHSLAISAVRTADAVLVTGTSPFSLVAPLGLAASGIPAVARAAPAPTGGGARLAHQTGGEPGAAIVGDANGGLRAGFVPVAEARIQNAP